MRLLWQVEGVAEAEEQAVQAARVVYVYLLILLCHRLLLLQLEQVVQVALAAETTTG